MAKLTTNKLSRFFEDTPEFSISRRPDKETNFPFQNNITIGYLNFIRPTTIHVVGESELTYLNSLDDVEQKKLIDFLLQSGAVFFIFIRPNLPTPLFIARSDLFLIDTALSLKQIRISIDSHISSFAKNTTTLHGSFVIIYNQGILITGESGIGKSTVLLSLLNRQHMWVADDCPIFTLNDKNEIIGHAACQLENFVHVKSIGVIDMDNEYGRSKQLKRHQLSAIIHLQRNNCRCTEQGICEFDPLTSEDVLGVGIPKWTLNIDRENLSLLIEKCAHQLVLHSWGIFDSKQFDEKLARLLNQVKSK